jgi:ubiquinone/menaquinone biosynthesis C-methylase UbiE
LEKKISRIRELNDAHAKVFDTIINVPFYFDHLNQVLMELEPEKNKLYLDLGCGTGNLLKLASEAGFSFVGVDFSSEMLKNAKVKSKDLVMADLHHLPFRDECADGAVNINVLYQLNRPEEFLMEVHRVLKPGGKVIISTPRPTKTPFGFVPGLLKTAAGNPKFLINLREIKKMSAYNEINRRIIDLNPYFYENKELEKMLKDFNIQSMKKAYAGQNWMISAVRPPKK